MIRLCLFLLYSVPEKSIYAMMVVILLVAFSAIVLTFQPYKTQRLNVTFIFLQLFTILLIISFQGIVSARITAQEFTLFFLILAIFAGLFPFLYITMFVAYLVFKHHSFVAGLTRKITGWRLRRAHAQEYERLPDRIENSREYHRENLANLVGQELGCS